MLNLRLNDYRQIYFDKEDRKRIPETVIEEIRWGWGEGGGEGDGVGVCGGGVRWRVLG